MAAVRGRSTAWREACRALGVPVVGGNVSLYNESNGVDIDPSPVVGTVGLVDDLDRRPARHRAPGGHHARAARRAGRHPVGVARGRGRRATAGHAAAGRPRRPAAVAAFVRDAVAAGRLLSAHDLAGGFGPTLAEMSASSGVGATVDLPAPDGHVALFAETPSAVLCAVEPGDLDGFRNAAADAGVPAQVVGAAGGSRLRIGDLVDLAVDELVGRGGTRCRRRSGQGPLSSEDCAGPARARSPRPAGRTGAVRGRRTSPPTARRTIRCWRR